MNQLVIQGAEAISDKEHIERKMAEPKTSGKAQVHDFNGTGGLFDVTQRNQLDLVDFIKGAI